MAAKETGKERASRIPLNYFKKLDALQMPKLLLAGFALVAALSWVGATQLRRDERSYSRGPVANVHAAWDARCDACHQPFSPEGSDSFLRSVSAKDHPGELLCKNCHAGPQHHASEREELVPACAACHREHLGRDNLLTRNADQECTGCHRDLSISHVGEGGGSKFEKVITGFTKNHPEFRSIADPRKLKFNHKLHMTRGLVQIEANDLPKDQRPAAWKFSNLEKSERERYQKFLGENDPEASVQLTCAACHQTDPSNIASGGPTQAVRAAGAYMQPVNFESNCKACHPLTVPAGNNKEIAVPHRLQPGEVRDYIWGALAKEASNKRDEQLHQPTRSLPGTPLPAESSVRAQIEAKTKEGLDFLGKNRVEGVGKYLLRGKPTCGECHHIDRSAGGDGQIVPTNIPAVWLKHSRFDHTSHRAIDCMDCHAKTVAGDKLGEGNVPLPAIDSCKQCHGPSSQSAKSFVGGARSDCVECHRYHNGDQPLQGLGSLARDPKKKSAGPAEFLSGSHSP